MLRVGGKALENGRPETVEPAAERLEAARIQAVDVPGARRLEGHKIALSQDSEVLRDSRAAHRELCCQLADGGGTRPQALENLSPRAVAEGI